MNAGEGFLDDLLDSQQPAFCEHIICLSHGERDSRWWINLLDPTVTPFTTASRLHSAKIDQCRAEVERSVLVGCRPLLFVPRPSDWPMVYDAIGRYRGFAKLYVYGRDDRQMRYLLHAPSSEILRVHASRGQLLVPDLEYGQALDRLLPVSLGDFMPLPHAPQEKSAQIANLSFRFFSRLNPYRLLRVTLDPPSLALHLEQVYRRDAQDKDPEPCEQPIGLGENLLQFPGGVCDITDQDHLASAAIALLALPMADRRPWIQSIANRLARISGNYLSQSLQLALAGLAMSQEALGALWACLDVTPTISTSPRRRRLGVQVAGVPPNAQPTASVGVLITEVRSGDAGLDIDLVWNPEHRPVSEPEFRVRVERETGAEETLGSRVTSRWWTDRAGLTLQVAEMSLDRPEVAWHWSQADAVLTLRVREQPANPATPG